MDDKVLKVHHASHELTNITTLIDSCQRVIENKKDNNFSEEVILKILISIDKPVTDGGFTDYNIEELKLKKEDIIEIVKLLIEQKNIRKDQIIDDLKKM